MATGKGRHLSQISVGAEPGQGKYVTTVGSGGDGRRVPSAINEFWHIVTPSETGGSVRKRGTGEALLIGEGVPFSGPINKCSARCSPAREEREGNMRTGADEKRLRKGKMFST